MNAKNWKKIALGLGVVLVALSAGLWFQHAKVKQSAVVAEATPPEPPEPSYPYLIAPGSSLFEVLRGLDVSAKTIDELVVAARPVIDLGQLRAGTRFRLTHLTDPSSDLVGIDFQMSPIESIHMVKENGTWTARTQTEAVQSKVVTFNGIVKSSLWESAQDAGMDPELIVQLAEIFGWQVDFAREVRGGDRWRLSVEQKSVKGKAIGWGSILAAEYQNGAKTYDATLFRMSDGTSGYFAHDGSNLRRTFLKSPIRYGRITSRFSMHRFHPILKITRPHLGVDYGAPRGTPVRAIGDGVVTFVGRNGGSGKTLKIKHSSKYQSIYRHLNGYAKSIKVGTHVKQGELVAYVGSTGLATGPHLHFEFWVNGRVVDPLSVNSPPANPIPPDQMAEFERQVDQVRKGLPSWETKVVARQAASDEH